MMAQKPSAPTLPLPSRPGSVAPQPQLPNSFNLGAMGYENPYNANPSSNPPGNPLSGITNPNPTPHGNPLSGLPASLGLQGGGGTDYEGLQRLMASNPGGLKLDDLLRGNRETQPSQQTFNPTPWPNNARYPCPPSTVVEHCMSMVLHAVGW